jgi:hypothetical protein
MPLGSTSQNPLHSLYLVYEQGMYALGSHCPVGKYSSTIILQPYFTTPDISMHAITSCGANSVHAIAYTPDEKLHKLSSAKHAPRLTQPSWKPESECNRLANALVVLPFKVALRNLYLKVGASTIAASVLSKNLQMMPSSLPESHLSGVKRQYA